MWWLPKILTSIATAYFVQTLVKAFLRLMNLLGSAGATDVSPSACDSLRFSPALLFSHLVVLAVSQSLRCWCHFGWLLGSPTLNCCLDLSSSKSVFCFLSLSRNSYPALVASIRWCHSKLLWHRAVRAFILIFWLPFLQTSFRSFDLFPKYC